jgi:peptidylprolyl isomerase
MKHIFPILLLAATTVAASAQTTAKPTTAATKPTATAATAQRASTAQKSAVPTSALKLPPGVPPAKGIVKTEFALRYEDIAVGTGALAEQNKMYKVHYTGWLGANGRPDDGTKFDSSFERRTPVMDKDGKPELDADKKPKLSDPHPEPFVFPQGFGRLIPGWDQGFGGMKIGGKRRLFIPWQLAYGAQGRPGPDAAHPGIPPKADLIFDVELLDVTDLPTPPNHPGMMGAHPMPGGGTPHPATPAETAKPATTAAPAQSAPPAATSAPAPAQPVTQPAPATTTAPAQPQPK